MLPDSAPKTRHRGVDGEPKGGMNIPWLPAKGSVAVGRGKYIYMPFG